MNTTDPTPHTPADALVDDIIRWDTIVATDGPCDGTWDSLADYLIGRGWTRAEKLSDRQVARILASHHANLTIYPDGSFYARCSCDLWGYGGHRMSMSAISAQHAQHVAAQLREALSAVGLAPEEHKLTETPSGRGCVCGWSSGPQATYNAADRLAAEHMRRSR